MAMSTSSSGRRSRGGRRSRRAALAEINVTPLVDVMLVLLIIFMISAPLLNSGIKIQLPKTEAAALRDEKEPLTVSIDKDGVIYLQDKPVSYAQLSPRLLAMADGDTSQAVYVRAAATVPYEKVAQVMAKLSTSGFAKLSLVTDPMGKAAPVAATTKPETSNP